jgi:hypothetical protein
MICSECPSPAIAEYRETGGEPILLCDECTVRYVRVTGIKGMVLMISAFRREVIAPPANELSNEQAQLMIDNGARTDEIVHAVIDRATGEES